MFLWFCLWKHFCCAHMPSESFFPWMQALCGHLILNSEGRVFTSRSTASPRPEQFIAFLWLSKSVPKCYFLMSRPKAIRKISLRNACWPQNPNEMGAQQLSIGKVLLLLCFNLCNQFSSISTVSLWRSCRGIYSVN